MLMAVFGLVEEWNCERRRLREMKRRSTDFLAVGILFFSFSFVVEGVYIQQGRKRTCFIPRFIHG
jgi:hypothetical protein